MALRNDPHEVERLDCLDAAADWGWMAMTWSDLRSFARRGDAIHETWREAV
jgi:hypothetical protein